MGFKFRHGCELASRLPRRELDNRAAELFDIGTTCIVFREGFSPKHSQVCHLLLPIGITLEPKDGEHLIDAVHHPGTIAVQDLVIGKVGGDDGREFPVIAVGDQILNGCVIRTIALASLRFRTEFVQEEVLRLEEFLVAGSILLQLVLELVVQLTGRGVDHRRGELLVKSVHRVHEGGLTGTDGSLEEQAGADGVAHHPFGDLLDLGSNLRIGDVLELDAAGLDGLAVDLAERFHQRLFFHSLYLSRKLGDKVIPCRQKRIGHES